VRFVSQIPRWLAAWVVLSASATLAMAQEVEVTTVKFTNVRSPTGSNGTWLESEITLNVKPVVGNPSQMVSRIRVSLLMGFELPAMAGGERRLEHFRAEAECPALEPGRAYIRFYLPPEIVKRDQLHGDPKYWGIELAVGGKLVPAAKAAYATALAGAEQRKNFQTKAAAAALANEGILLPQYLTPFVNEYPRATPSFLRREGR
jgi:hypothetical protein